MVPGARIELATPAFSGRRSTNELPRQRNFSSLGSASTCVNSPSSPCEACPDTKCCKVPPTSQTVRVPTIRTVPPFRLRLLQKCHCQRTGANTINAYPTICVFLQVNLQRQTHQALAEQI